MGALRKRRVNVNPSASRSFGRGARRGGADSDRRHESAVVQRPFGPMAKRVAPAGASNGRGGTASASETSRKKRDGATQLVRGPQRERHEPDYLIVVAIISLAAIGILMIYSSSGVRSYLFEEDPFAVVGSQLFWGGLGLVLMGVMMRVDYRFLRLVSVPVYVIAVVLLILVLLPPIGPLRPVSVGGSARWLEIGPLPSLHPAEFAKLAVIIYLAHWLAKRGFAAGSFLWGTIPFILIAGPVILLIALEPDLGTTGVVTLTTTAMFFVAGASLWQFFLMGPGAIGFAAWVISNNAYQMARVQAFLDPWRDPLGIGFHTIQGLLALALGGVFGIGLGQSRQPGALHLPNAANDFVFAVVGQEFGLIGGLIVITLYLLFAYRGVRVALGAPDTFGALLATGITAWLTFQAFINIGVVVSLFPITGITLPFVSDGGSSLLVSFAAVGILLSISRETMPRGTWNNADPDRGRRNRWSHLPGIGRRSVPSGTPS